MSPGWPPMPHPGMGTLGRGSHLEQLSQLLARRLEALEAVPGTGECGTGLLQRRQLRALHRPGGTGTRWGHAGDTPAPRGTACAPLYLLPMCTSQKKPSSVARVLQSVAPKKRSATAPRTQALERQKAWEDTGDTGNVGCEGSGARVRHPRPPGSPPAPRAWRSRAAPSRCHIPVAGPGPGGSRSPGPPAPSLPGQPCRDTRDPRRYCGDPINPVGTTGTQWEPHKPCGDP